MVRKNILVLGDSHMRVFKHWLWRFMRPFWHFSVHYVPGATISGIENIHSASGARLHFNNVLAIKNFTHIFVCLGEVDIGYALWIRAKQKKTTPDILLEELVQNYNFFLQELCNYAPVTLISAPYQTVVDWEPHKSDVSNLRKKVAIPIVERNKMTERLNNCMAISCKDLNINFIDGCSMLNANYHVKHFFCNPQDPYDHHYRRGHYALWLAFKKLT